jgi:hypothetical protein
MLRLRRPETMKMPSRGGRLGPPYPRPRINFHCEIGGNAELDIKSAMVSGLDSPACFSQPFGL